MERKADSRPCRDTAAKKPCCPKPLSSKKFPAIPGARSERPRSSAVAQRPACPVWPRRARVRELRVRCVARKFLYLWIRKTFGRVPPSKARCYYEQRLLRKVFEEWKEEWWVCHQEWKLSVRADCHYRYYLYSLAFQRWRAFVRQQWEMRNKLLRAADHDAKRKTRQAWKSWLIYVVFRRTKHQMQTSALELRQQNLLWLCWSEWRQRLRQVRLSHALDATAVTHSALRLQQKAWLWWREQLLQARRERQKETCAAEHHQRQQKRRSLSAWRAYLQGRRLRRRQRELAEQVHRITVLQTHLCSWRRAWAWRESLRAQLARVEQLGQRVALRRVFTHWKHYVLLCAEQAARAQAADDHHRHRSLRWGFHALKDHVAHARRQRVWRNLAHRQHEVSVLRRFWSLWQFRAEQREERGQLPSLCAAWEHYRVALQRRTTRLWLQYAQRRRCRQVLRARADGHFQQRVLPAAFAAWRALWKRRLQERVLGAKAAGFLRETLEKRVFACWCRKVSQRQERRLADRIEDGQPAGSGAPHPEASELGLGQVEGEPGRAGFGAAAAEAGLRAPPAHRASEGTAGLAARNLPLLPQVHLSGVRLVLQQVALRESRYHRQLLRAVLLRWRGNSRAQAEAADRMRWAGARYERSLCSQVLTRWREVVCVRVFRRQQEQAAVREAQKVLDRGRLGTCFRCWRARVQGAAWQRVQLERAVRHDCRRLLLWALGAWRAYHLWGARKKLLQRLGTQLQARTLGRSCFHRWRQQLLSRRTEQQATARALWFWAFSLQAKAWAAWLAFVAEGRHEKARMERAAQAHRRGLLREGTVRLLRFSASVRASRQQAQARQQVQAAHSLQRVVLRCALHWKQKALGGGRGPLQSSASRAPPQGIASTLEPRPVGTRGPLSTPGSLGLASGDPLFPVMAAHPPRQLPRRPHFLLELELGQSRRPRGPSVLHRQRPRKLPEHCPAQPGRPSRLPDLSLPPAASRGPEPPHPPAAWVLAQPAAPGLGTQLPESHLLLPGDLLGSGGPLQPAPQEARGEAELLEAELEAIQWQLQHCQAAQRDLRSCRRQADSLRRWLELSQEEPRPEDPEAERLVQSQLREVERQIRQLEAELQAQRQPVQTCISRVQALLRALR
ncbi:protein SFI1 homolog isoform X3 [Erinaceus europaeus]|uniref:Protein SFI1 homolog isoform X3 n=1 Tax=Erinaceus europaeus TaxID=9365 RepID=A0ABM3XIU8_ERIEU|nr:protein SFI1 homolog isoform X3 [Erinaceus europaeus]